MELILIKNKNASLSYEEMDTNFRVLYTKPKESINDFLDGYLQNYPNSNLNTDDKNMLEKFLDGYLQNYPNSAANDTNI